MSDDEERDALAEILVNVGKDVAGDQLVQRFVSLFKRKITAENQE